MKAQWKRITAQIADFKQEDRVTVPVGPLLWARGEIERLTNLLEHRADLQAAGTHPAPCARHCEAVAFGIEIRGLKRQRDALLETLVTALPYVEDAAESPLFKAGVVGKAVSKIRSIIASVEGAA